LVLQTLFATPPLGQIASMSAAAATRVIDLPSLAATEAMAAAAAALARPGDAILLQGPLGAGKSVFARAFLRAASGDPALEVPSPTFTLMQSYETRIGTVHHFDLWRLDGPGGLTELGWEEARDGIVLVEWPDRLGALRPDEALSVTLHINDEETRRAVLSGWPSRLGRIA
jgi:tRNA threonylcarbamoyladenosine biosynthesis protein TsaE